MQSGFAAVFSRPLWPRADQPHAGAIGIVVNLPRCIEQCVDVFVREEIRRAMRAVQNADLPFVRILRKQFVGKSPRRVNHSSRHFFRILPPQHIAGPKHASRVAAEPAENESRSAAEIFGHIDAAANRDVRPRAWPCRRADGAAPNPRERRRPASGAPACRPLWLACLRRQGQPRRLNGSATSVQSSCISSAAADSGFPTSRLARRNASVSIGPEGGTPTCQNPNRPG